MLNILPHVFSIFCLNKGPYLNYLVLALQNKMVLPNTNIVTCSTIFVLFFIRLKFPSNFGGSSSHRHLSHQPLSFIYFLWLLPFEVCFHQKHDYFALRPFGCTCFVLLSPHECSKLSPNAVICHFLGYGMEHKGFKCFDPKAICLRVSYHVSFRKHIAFYSLLTASI